MGRKRKIGAIPTPLALSLPRVVRAKSSSSRRARQSKKTQTRGVPCTRTTTGTDRPHPCGIAATPIAPTSSPSQPSVLLEPRNIPNPVDGPSQGLRPPPPLLMNPSVLPHEEHDRGAAGESYSPVPQQSPRKQGMSKEKPPRRGAPSPSARAPPEKVVKSVRKEEEEGGGRGEVPSVGMRPSDVVRHLRESGWRLGSCWGSDCNCSVFKPRSTPSSAVGASSTSNSNRLRTPITSPVHGISAATCDCGHRSCAHELVDAVDDGQGILPLPSGHHHRQQQRQRHQQQTEQKEHKHQCYRTYHGPDQSSGPATGNEIRLGLRRFFSAVRNARAIGDCGLYEDSEGVRGWGSGWFLSRLARRYIQEARQAMAELGGGLHGAPAVSRCLATAEALLSGGDITGQWSMPDSLPSTSIYQALGTGIASELDLAYWHAHYTAASRFDAGSARADPSSSSPFSVSQVVPPPEVYFICLAFHVPSIAELQALPEVDTNPALRRMLDQVFDFPVRGAGGSGRESTGEPERRAGITVKLDSEDGEIQFPVLTNPLLAVAQSTWLETAVSADARSWVPHFPPRFGDNEGTMRGADPGLPPPVRARCDATRDWSARLFAFAVPNRLAIEACRRAVEICGGAGQEQGREGRKGAIVPGIIEVGAGLGYWKWVLEGEARPGLNLSYLAVDKDPPTLSIPGGSAEPATCALRTGEEGRRGNRMSDRKRGRGGRRNKSHQSGSSCGGPTHNEYHGGAPGWAAVEEGGPERLRSLSAAAFPVLLLCYPPPSIGASGVGGEGARGASGASTGCMGADALACFSGKVVLYIGEVGGDTGSPRLEEALRADWDLVEEVELPCFSCTVNRLMVFTRKGATFHRRPSPLVCVRPTAAGAGVGPARGNNAKEHTHRSSAGSGGVQRSSDGAGDDVLGPVMAMYRCSGCGATAEADGAGRGVQLRRCRLTRAVSYCSERCMTLDGQSWRANLDVRHIHLAAGTSANLAEQGRSHGGVFRDKKRFKRLAL